MRSTSLLKFALVLGFGAMGCAGSDEAQTDSVATGGVSTGGAVASGGVSSGGLTSTGGVSTGGTASADCTNIRPTGTEWDEATCDQWATETSECNSSWMSDGNYCNESCGRCDSSSAGGSSGAGSGGAASGGSASTGGSSSGGSASTGGGASGGTPSTCSEPEGEICANQSGSHCGYTFEYWKDQGSGCLTNTVDGFSVEWSNINNLLGRKGLRPGSKTQVVTYDADYQPNGNSYLCVYGWTRGPLIEYYIVDSWGTWRPPGGQSLGTVTSDGGTYDIYKTERVNQPSIDGNATFYQYWSVRTEKRSSGTITVGNHFAAWESHGMNMGSLYEVSMTVEGYQSSGTASVSVSMQ